VTERTLSGQNTTFERLFYPPSYKRLLHYQGIDIVQHAWLIFAQRKGYSAFRSKYTYVLVQIMNTHLLYAAHDSTKCSAAGQNPDTLPPSTADNR